MSIKIELVLEIEKLGLRIFNFFSKMLLKVFLILIFFKKIRYLGYLLLRIRKKNLISRIFLYLL